MPCRLGHAAPGACPEPGRAAWLSDPLALSHYGTAASLQVSRVQALVVGCQRSSLAGCLCQTHRRRLKSWLGRYFQAKTCVSRARRTCLAFRLQARGTTGQFAVCGKSRALPKNGVAGTCCFKIWSRVLAFKDLGLSYRLWLIPSHRTRAGPAPALEPSPTRPDRGPFWRGHRAAADLRRSAASSGRVRSCGVRGPAELP